MKNSDFDQSIPIQPTLSCGSSNQGYTKSQILSLIQRHSKYTERLDQQIHAEKEAVLRNSGSFFAKKVNSMIREVFKVMDRQRQFTRTQVHPKGILYGTVTFEHHIEDLVLGYFHDRFPQLLIILWNESKRESIIITEDGKMGRSSHTLNENIEYYAKNRTDSPLYSDLDYSSVELFDEFYASQFIKARENKRYFQHMIPKKMMQHPGLKGGVEARFRNKIIDSFIIPKE